MKNQKFIGRASVFCLCEINFLNDTEAEYGNRSVDSF